MGTYAINIDAEKVEEQISAILDRILKDELRSKYSNSGKVISAAVKELVYSHKDEIIERIVDRASREMVRKGLPRFLERIGADDGS